MEMDCKLFAKNIRLLDKEMRAWDTYSGVENSVKNMLTSLRAVGDLQNPAIRDRHWQQLMQATGVGIQYLKFFCSFVYLILCNLEILILTISCWNISHLNYSSARTYHSCFQMQDI